MSQDVKLLPLPELHLRYGHFGEDALAYATDYARANMEPLIAENERLREEVARLESMTAVTMGVGRGNGSLFVHGDCDSIKAAQALVFRAERLAEECDRLQRQLRQAHKDYGYELQDPNGTIWEHAAKQQARAERLRVDAERYRFIAGQHGLWWEEELDAAIERDRAAFDASLEQEGGKGGAE